MSEVRGNSSASTGAFDSAAFDSAAVRAQFPILGRTLAMDRPLVYLDSGATSQRPQRVIDAMRRFDETSNSAVHRGAHQLAAEATVAYEEARAVVAGFVGADEEEIVWTKNATEALNVLALALSDAAAGIGPETFANPDGTPDSRIVLRPGDSIVTTELEHHANLVPWQRLARRSGATLRWMNVTDEGRLDLERGLNLIDETTRVVAVTGASNVTGAVVDVAAVVSRAREVGASGRSAAGERGPIVVLDACQMAPHLAMDLHALDVDAAAFSSHKMYGPTGIGALYVRRELAELLPPALTGGSMVETVTMEGATFMPPPVRFEAGSQPITQVIGFAEACRFLNEAGMEAVAQHEREITRLLLDGVASVPGVRLIGPGDAADRLALVSFEVEGVHPHDAGQILDAAGVAVRVGHHCAQPVHRRFGVTASTRASAGIYTNEADVAAFVEQLGQVRSFFGLEG